MKKMLIIDATGRTKEQSRTKVLSGNVLDSLNLKQYEVTILDLYKTRLPFVNQEILESRISKKFTTEDQIVANDIVDKFEAADVVTFIYPVWNWSVPAILKTYIDLIMISRRNFTYKGIKIVGLLENKKAMFISTGGGPLVGSLMCKLFNMENPNLYMKKMMNTLGIKDTKTISIGAMSYKFKNKEKKIKFDKDLYQKHIQKLVEKRTTELNEFLNK